MPNVDQGCTTHSFACECREARFERMEAENRLLVGLLAAHHELEVASIYNVCPTCGEDLPIKLYARSSVKEAPDG